VLGGSNRGNVSRLLGKKSAGRGRPNGLAPISAYLIRLATQIFGSGGFKRALESSGRPSAIDHRLSSRFAVAALTYPSHLGFRFLRAGLQLAGDAVNTSL